MPATTLQSMAIRACLRNLSGITDVGETPYDIIKSVLRKIQNPAQLEEIEKNSPHIAEADSELWKAFMARDIPDWDSEEKLIVPSNPRSWGKAYRKMLRREQRAKETQEEALRAAMGGLQKAREENKAVFVDRIVPEKQKQGAFVDGVRNTSVNGWGMQRTPALQNAKKGRDVIAALRVQSRQASNTRRVDAGKPTGIRKATPTARGLKGQVAKAPEWMVRELLKPKSTVAPAAPLFPKEPAARVFAPNKEPSVRDTVLRNAEREARLRTLTQNKPKAASPPAQTGKMESTADREARLRALTQRKARPAASASPPAALSRPATVANSPPPKVQPAPRTTAREPSQETASARLGVGSSPARRPSPVPEFVRKRPAATSSPLMPAKRKRI